MAALSSVQPRCLTQPAKPTPIVGKPLRLQPVQFGTRDLSMAKVVCNAIVDATPGTFVPFNPLTNRRMRSGLRALGIPA